MYPEVDMKQQETPELMHFECDLPTMSFLYGLLP
jgi:hypothetical protein